MSWPLSPESLDGFLLAGVSAEEVHVLDSREPAAVDVLLDQMAEFLAPRATLGHILVKSSTTTRRPTTHEVSSRLLERVISRAVDVAGAPSVILGDGPVWGDVPYEDECERQGWAAMTRRLGVSIRDLNRDPWAEIAGGWPVSRTFLDAAAVISLTKAKTHRRFGVSLAEKTLLGVLSGGKLGHPKLSTGHHVVPWLLERICAAAPPIFSIIDGENGIEGNGPMEGRPTASHFLCFGPGCLGPEIRGIVEMGFDPVLVPSLHRPIPDATPTAFKWGSLRVTDVDFEPAPSCPWLYRSLDRRWGRGSKFTTLQRSVRAAWPIAESA